MDGNKAFYERVSILFTRGRFIFDGRYIALFSNPSARLRVNKRIINVVDLTKQEKKNAGTAAH